MEPAGSRCPRPGRTPPPSRDRRSSRCPPETSTLPLGSSVAVWSKRCRPWSRSALQVPEAGSYTSAAASGQWLSVPPRRAPCRWAAASPCGRRRRSWPWSRSALQVPVAGSYSSAVARLPWASPPATSTLPLGSSVAVWLSEARPWSRSRSRCPRPGRTAPPSRGSRYADPPRRAPCRWAAASPCGCREARPWSLSRSRCPRPGRTAPPSRGEPLPCCIPPRRGPCRWAAASPCGRTRGEAMEPVEAQLGAGQVGSPVTAKLWVAVRLKALVTVAVMVRSRAAR